MNTPAETREDRARPSVWPVYVMGAIIGLFSLSFTSWVWFVPRMAQIPAEAVHQLSPGAQNFQHLLQQLAPYTPVFGLYGLFGMATAVGAVLLRRWAWWCAIAWLALYTAWGVYLTAHMGISRTSLIAVLINVAFYGLIIWPLATRRQLFFPANRGGRHWRRRPVAR